MSAVRSLVIVGGGAAGIGAATEAERRGIDTLIVEAKDRLGGRAHSLEWESFRLDLGCTWLHSAERNSLRVEAERTGAMIDRKPTNWFGQYRNLGWRREEQNEAYRALQSLETRMSNDPPPSDRASDLLEPGGEWNAFLDAISGYINGAPLADVSVEDWLAYDNAASSQNLRLKDGYGALLGSLGARFNHRLSTPVTAVSRLAERVQLQTADGIIEAEKVVVTVPTPILPRIRFDPPMASILEAAEQLPLGIADKLFLSIRDPEEFASDAHVIGNPHSSQTGSYFIRPMGMPVVEGFFGGDGARFIEQLSEKDAAAFAIDELVGLFGSDFRSRLSPIAMSRWSHEPWICGSYSHARPGGAAARKVIEDGGDDRIAFAGEAVSRSDYSTAHGAYDSGVAAVRKLANSTG